MNCAHLPDVEDEFAAAEEQRKEELRRKWTAQVWNEQAQKFEAVVLPAPLIHGIESVVKEKSARKKQVRTSWSNDDKKTIVAIFKHLHRRKYMFPSVCRESYDYVYTMRHMRGLT